MTYNPETVFNRQITNSIALIVKQSEQGELHGSILQLADKILMEMSGDPCSEVLTRMARHLQAVGFDRLVEGTPVVHFDSKLSGHHLVLKEALNEPE